MSRLNAYSGALCLRAGTARTARARSSGLNAYSGALCLREGLERRSQRASACLNAYSGALYLRVLDVGGPDEQDLVATPTQGPCT